MSMTDRIYQAAAKRTARDRRMVFGAPEQKQDAQADADPDALPDGTPGDGAGAEPPPAAPNMDDHIRRIAARNRRR